MEKGELPFLYDKLKGVDYNAEICMRTMWICI